MAKELSRTWLIADSSHSQNVIITYYDNSQGLARGPFSLDCRKMLQANWLKSKALAVSWFIIMNILFVLPGSALPKTHWFTDLQLDKWVHVVLFAVLVFLWSSAFDLGLPKKSRAVLIVAISYGLLVEIVQKAWVPNRSFDLYDLLSDAVGSMVGLIVWLRANKEIKDK